MSLFAVRPDSSDSGQLVLAAILAVAGAFLLLPRPRGRSVAGGIAALLFAAVVSGLWIHRHFGEPGADWVGKLLFILFACGAVVFGTVLVAQRNPARGAIAFAFVILSTCGLFLLLAAPFLMAATVIIYAGAIVVTFLFVLMLSAANGPTGENDRSREPLLGSLAGFAFAGLVLFALNQSHATSRADQPEALRKWHGLTPLPTPLITPDERHLLAQAAEDLKQLEADDFYPPTERTHQDRAATITRIEEALGDYSVGLRSAQIEGSTEYGSIHQRLGGFRVDRPADAVLKQTEAIRKDAARVLARVESAMLSPDTAVHDEAKAAVRKLRAEVLLLAGAGELPARNTAGLGHMLYSEHLLSIELAGTLLLVATIGAIAIAHKKGAAA